MGHLCHPCLTDFWGFCRVLSVSVVFCQLLSFSAGLCGFFGIFAICPSKICSQESCSDGLLHPWLLRGCCKRLVAVGLLQLVFLPIVHLLVSTVQLVLLRAYFNWLWLLVAAAVFVAARSCSLQEHLEQAVAASEFHCSGLFLFETLRYLPLFSSLVTVGWATYLVRRRQPCCRP